MFTEPPSFPRIDMWTDTIASRGNHQSVWKYTLPDGLTESLAGATAIYTNPFGALVTGASNLGVVPDFSFFAVPGTDPPIEFDVFPGAPSVTEGNTIVFKGNYSASDPDDSSKTISKTGAYYRTLADGAIPVSNGSPLESAAGESSAVVIADTDTPISHTRTGKTLGSFAPPSAAGYWAVFAGFDNEDNPTAGGIYLAPLNGLRPRLRSVVEIGGPVPREKKGTTFNKLGEGVSFDGRFVAFWGAWGNETRTLVLQCPSEGNSIRNEYCRNKADNFNVGVPVHQGIFVHDPVNEQTTVVAKSPTSFADFVYWKFSGYVEGMGLGESEDTREPARWHSGTFVALPGLADGDLNDGSFHIAYKARTGQVVDGAYASPVDGVYLYAGPVSGPTATVVTTGTDGKSIDADATGQPITKLGIERDSFRGRSLVINAAMGSKDAGWAGIYMRAVPDELIK